MNGTVDSLGSSWLELVCISPVPPGQPQRPGTTITATVLPSIRRRRAPWVRRAAEFFATTMELMRMRKPCTLGVSLAALVLSSAAAAAATADARDGAATRGTAGFGAPDRYIAPAAQRASMQVVGRREIGR